MRTGIKNVALTEAIKRFTFMIKNGQRHQNFRNLKKVVRGLRRRRNWLAWQGLWPMKKDLKGVVGKVYGFQIGEQQQMTIREAKKQLFKHLEEEQVLMKPRTEGYQP